VFREDLTLTLNSAGNGTAALANGSARVVATSSNVSGDWKRQHAGLRADVQWQEERLQQY